MRGELSGHDADRRLRIGNAHLDLGEAIAAFARRDAHICTQREHQAARDRVTGDRADDRAGEVVYPERHPVDARDHRPLLLRPIARHRLQVGAGREEPRAANEHQRARNLMRQPLDRLHELPEQSHVHRVRWRAVRAQDHHPAVVVAQRDVLHRRSLSRRPPRLWRATHAPRGGD